MDDPNATRNVLTGLGLLLATAATILAVTLLWPRQHVPPTIAKEPATAAPQTVPSVDPSVFLPSASEYPPGFAPPAPGGAAYATLTLPTRSPREPAPAPCSPDAGLPAQRPDAQSPAQLILDNPQAPGGAFLSMLVADRGAWKDLSVLRTRLAQCPVTDTDGLHCTEVAHQPMPQVPADDLFVLEATCTRQDTDFVAHTLSYYGLVGETFVLVTASGEDPRPGESVFGLIVTKAHDGQKR